MSQSRVLFLSHGITSKERRACERDQQKWSPVLRPIALFFLKRAHDLIAKPLTLWRIMRHRTDERACDLARPDRAHRDGGGRASARSGRARPRRGRPRAEGRARTRGDPRGVLRGTPGCGRDRLCHRACGTRDGVQAAAVGTAGFLGDRNRRAVDERPCRDRPRSAPHGDGARRRCRERAAHLGRCARLRCARCGRDRALGRYQTVRSRRKPQADAGRAIVRCHRPDVADGGAAAALDRGDAMDVARRAFAAGFSFNACGALERLGRAALRCRAVAQSSWPVWPVDHGME